MVRIDFDIRRPLVASSTIDCKGQRFEHGDAFPWQTLGFDERGIIEMWMAGLVDHVEPKAVPVARIDVTPAKSRSARR